MSSKPLSELLVDVEASIGKIVHGDPGDEHYFGNAGTLVDEFGRLMDAVKREVKNHEQQVAWEEGVETVATMNKALDRLKAAREGMRDEFGKEGYMAAAENFRSLIKSAL